MLTFWLFNASRRYKKGALGKNYLFSHYLQVLIKAGVYLSETDNHLEMTL